MKNKPSTEVNPIVLCKLACAYSGIKLNELRHGNRSKKTSFVKCVLAYAFVKHAGYTLEGACQCLNLKDHHSASYFIAVIESGRYDEDAKKIIPKAVNATDYAGIVYQRALNTPLPKHRRLVAS